MNDPEAHDPDLDPKEFLTRSLTGSPRTMAKLGQHRTKSEEEALGTDQPDDETIRQFNLVFDECLERR